MAIYRIKDWDTRYENNRTRGYKHLDWVPMPNKMDGDGYTELVELSKGEKEYYGALRFAGWCAIVEIASRCNPRGTLCRDSAGVCGHTSESLSRISRLPKLVFDLVFDRALKVGWIVDMSNENNDMHNDAEILHIPALNRIEENRIEENRTHRGAHKKFIKPTPEEIQKYFESIDYKIEGIGQKFFDYYESKNWVVGKSPMKNWQAACRTWKSNGYDKSNVQEMKPQKLSAAARQTAINLGVNPDEL